MSDGGLTRKQLLAAAGVGGALLAAGGATGFFVADETLGNDDAGTVPFYGEHQAGIVTPAPDKLVFAAFDLTTGNAHDVAEMLRAWTSAAAMMTAGEPLGSNPESDPMEPAIDTGEALGLPAEKLTLTFGFGESVFTLGRFGLESRRPSLLTPIGPLPRDNIDPAISGGDLCVQACANDPQVAFHAVRNLARIGRGTAVLRWAQLGFGRTSSTTSSQVTPRNLLGFKDGTNNLHGDSASDMAKFVWVGDEEPQQWFRGGSYLVSRRIRMFIEIWDHAALGDQEQTIGRFKTSGAPLTGTKEHDVVNLAAREPSGLPAIPLNAHIRLAGPKDHGGLRILRRGYSFTDGIDPSTGDLDAGLFFIAYQKDPHKQFAAIQRKLGEDDALNEYIEHTSNGLFAVPPGIQKGGFIGEGLFS